MASKENDSFRHKIKEELICSVCLELYTTPRILPCYHTFCEDCLDNLALNKESDTYYISCPVCREKIKQPEEGARGFPKAFQIINIVDIHRQEEKKQNTCSKHRKPLEMFCKTCDDTICADCASYTHKDHKYELLDDYYPKIMQTIENSLTTISIKIEGLKDTLVDMATTEADVRKKGEEVVTEIQQTVEEKMESLRQSEMKLINQAKRVTEAKLKELSIQTEIAQASLKRLQQLNKDMDERLKAYTPQQIITNKTNIIEGITEACAQVNIMELHEMKNNASRIKFIKDLTVSESLQHLGDIVSSSSPKTLQESRAKEIEQLEYFPKQRELSFLLSLETPDNTLLSVLPDHIRLSVPPLNFNCRLVPVGKDHCTIETTVTATEHPGVYRINCNPSATGKHRVEIQVDDVKLENRSLVIPINPYLDDMSPIEAFSMTNRPWRVAISNSKHIMVTERYNNCITILDSNGKKVKSLGGNESSCSVEFHDPRGIAITTDNHILVSDSNRIQKISMDGDLRASVGTKSGTLQFNQPEGIAISPTTGLIYIADASNHRIQVLNPDLSVSRSFGAKGTGSSQFNTPSDIAFDSKGLVYVTDTFNNRIQKFTPSGKIVNKFSNKSFGSGKLNTPIGITIDTMGSDLVYVSEKSHCISVFTSEGDFVNSFGGGVWPLKTPIGIKFDKKRVLCICDSGNRSIKFY